jgi:tRNA(fMet)-specific endonuclease VapC
VENQRTVVSAIIYAEMRFGAIGKKASPRHAPLVEAFCARLDAILVSNNVREFERVPGLILEDWVD